MAIFQKISKWAVNLEILEMLDSRSKSLESTMKKACWEVQRNWTGRGVCLHYNSTSVALIKYPEQKQLREETVSFYFTVLGDSPWWQWSRAGSNLTSYHSSSVVKDTGRCKHASFLTCSQPAFSFLMPFITPWPRKGTTSNGLGLPTSINNQENWPMTYLQASLIC